MAHLSLRVWGKSGGQDTVTFTPRYFKVQEIFPQGITGVTNRKKAACHQNKCNNCSVSQDRFSCILYFFFFAASAFASLSPSHSIHSVLFASLSRGAVLMLSTGSGGVQGTLQLLYTKIPLEDSGFRWPFHILGPLVPERLMLHWRRATRTQSSNFALELGLGVLVIRTALWISCVKEPALHLEGDCPCVLFSMFKGRAQTEAPLCSRAEP